MKISYNWLKQYIDIDLSVDEVSTILTDIGLEVEGIEEFESVKGGLEGIVIGEVKTCEQHPNADRLSKTTVDVDTGELLPIVCGAPNVAAGQKVLVATVGTTLYSGDDSFQIKKSKIRGEVSEGMICAEDELGLGDSHDGIMVLPDDVKIGTNASDYFNIERDTIFEIGLTPNRVDSSSHIGTARDLAAFLKQTQAIDYNKPSVNDFKIDSTETPIEVIVENSEACPRYCGVTITGLKVEASPEWLQNRLKAIGLSPINNIVDITNYVLHETGQPLHAFDYDKITGNKVIVKTLEEGTAFTTLDEEDRKLSNQDLMICNAEGGMCIAGVFGGITSGVTEKTTKVFLESAYFNPVWVRKTAKRHNLNTDASFRFERGIDPQITIYALKRAAQLMKEIAGGNITSEIIDVYPTKMAENIVEVKYAHIDRLIGKHIEKERIHTILEGLEIKILEKDNEKMKLNIPLYRVDVTREADVIEEILRIYGYNNVEISESLHASLSYIQKPDKEKVIDTISNMLASSGYAEIMANSLTRETYYKDSETYKEEEIVHIYNPLSSDLGVMRPGMLHSGLETIAYNSNRQNNDLKLFEFGFAYHRNADKDDVVKRYPSNQHLSIFITGNKTGLNWAVEQQPTNFYMLKATVEKVLSRLGFNIDSIQTDEFNNEIFSEGLSLINNKKEIAQLGIVSKKMLKIHDIKTPVYYAVFNWESVMKDLSKHKIQYREIPKFPEVRRDLALLLDKDVRFGQIQDLANRTEKKLLKKVTLFDVYEGEKVEEGKKSYAVNFVLQDSEKTLNDKQIDKIMNNLIRAFEKELGAKLR